MENWSAFFVGLIIIGGLGVLASLLSGPINREMARVEERSNGRVPH